MDDTLGIDEWRPYSHGLPLSHWSPDHSVLRRQNLEKEPGLKKAVHDTNRILRKVILFLSAP